MSLVRSTATIGGYTLISRVLGFLRDVTIASALGASMYSDAFLVAFKLPNVLRRLFAEGAFNSAFVPLFSGMLVAESEKEAKQFASEVMSFLLLILILVTAVFILIMPELMFVFAPGFDKNPEKFALTITLTRITMPYIIFISLVSLLGGILNSHHKFAAVAATPILMNLSLIIIPSCITTVTPSMAHALSVAVMLSGIVQFAWLAYFCHKAGMMPRFVRPRLTPHVKKLLKLIAPVALGAGVAQINIFIDLSIASFFNGGNSYLYYADRINELPLAVIGIAVGTALLPMLSRQIREGKQDEANATQNRAIELSLFLSLPAAVAIWVIAEPIITAMFQRGAFDAHDSAATYKVLMAFAIGLPAFILVKILSPGFYANHDTKTPFKIATGCVLLNLILNLILMWPLQYVGMALATSIAGWVNVIAMLVILLKRRWLTLSPELKLELAKTLAASLVMAFVLTALHHWTALYFNGGEVRRFTALIVTALGGGASYFILAYALNGMNIRGSLASRRAARAKS